MLKFIDRIILLILFIGGSIICVAQTTSEVADTTKIEFELMPKSIRFGMDVVGLVKTLSISDYTEFDFTGDIAIHKYFITFDYSIFERNRMGTGIDYLVDGNFFRVGIESNFLKKDPDGNAFFVGVKYARGKSDHSLSFNDTDPNFGEFNGARSFNNVKSRWFEMNSGIKVKLFSEVWLGFTGRLRFALKHDKSLDLQPYEIPGYGLAEEKIMWGFDYYVFYRIPFKKK